MNNHSHSYRPKTKQTIKNRTTTQQHIQANKQQQQKEEKKRRKKREEVKIELEISTHTPPHILPSLPVIFVIILTIYFPDQWSVDRNRNRAT